MNKLHKSELEPFYVGELSQGSRTVLFPDEQCLSSRNIELYDPFTFIVIGKSEHYSCIRILTSCGHVGYAPIWLPGRMKQLG